MECCILFYFIYQLHFRSLNIQVDSSLTSFYKSLTVKDKDYFDNSTL